MDWKRWTLLAAIVLTSALVVAPGVSLAQDNEAPRERGDRAERGDRERGDRGRRRFDPEAMRQRMMQYMQRRLDATDEEWKVIGPRLEKVMTLAREGQAGMGRMWGGRNRDNDENQADQPQIVQKSTALRELIEQDDPDPDKVVAALQAYREARAEHQKKLDEARAELKELLTVEQEAQLVLMGLLE